MKTLPRSYRSPILVLVLFLFQIGLLNAQFTIVDPALTSTINCDNNGDTGFRLIADDGTNNNEAAAVWNNQNIDLDVGFVLNFSTNFSSSNPNDEADGICFVLHNAGTGIVGAFGGNIGYQFAPGGAFAQSVAVEIDFFDNTDDDDSRGDNVPGDNDHMAIVNGGSLGNVQVGPTILGNGDIVDGADRNGTITWDPCNLVFTAFYDGVTLTWNTDIRTEFADPNNVTWGFTAGAANDDANHDICIAPIIISAPCCSIACEDRTDLTACTEEGDFGYIILRCEATNYSWTFPAGSTAMEFTQGSQSIILNASPGTYTVTVSDSNGCTEERTYVIEEDCCDDKPCDLPAPENLKCSQFNEIDFLLSWGIVPGAAGYEVEITPNANQCECEEPEGNSYTEIVGTNSLPFTIVNFKCFSWRVRAICEDRTTSPYSNFRCFRGSCGLPNFGPENGSEKAGQSTSAIPKFSVYPNPAGQELTVLNKSVLNESTQIRMMNNLGQVVKTIELPANETKVNIPTDGLSSGIYFLDIRTKDQLIQQEKIILNKSSGGN